MSKTPTNPELDRLGAGILGYEYRNEERRMNYISAPGYYKEGVLISGFSPSTNIAHALECAGKSRLQIKLHQNAGLWYATISKQKLHNVNITGNLIKAVKWTVTKKFNCESLPNCARQIMLTLRKVEK